MSNSYSFKRETNNYNYSLQKDNIPNIEQDVEEMLLKKFRLSELTPSTVSELDKLMSEFKPKIGSHTFELSNNKLLKFCIE